MSASSSGLCPIHQHLGAATPLCCQCCNKAARQQQAQQLGLPCPAASDAHFLWALQLEICPSLGGVQECARQGAAHAPQQHAYSQAQPDAGCLVARAVHHCYTIFICMPVHLQLFRGIRSLWLCRGGSQVGLAVACMWYLVHFGHVHPLVAGSHFPLLEQVASCCVLCPLRPRSSCTRPHQP